MKALERYCGFYGKRKKMKSIGRWDLLTGRLHPAYQKTQDDPHNWKIRCEYEDLLSHLPDRAWVE